MPQNVKQKIRRNLKKGLVILEDTVRKTKAKSAAKKKSAPKKKRSAKKKKSGSSLWKSLFILGLWTGLF